MRPKLTHGTCVLGLCAVLVGNVVAAGDPLPSWNDTASKKAIVAFVEREIASVVAVSCSDLPAIFIKCPSIGASPGKLLFLSGSPLHPAALAPSLSARHVAGCRLD